MGRLSADQKAKYAALMQRMNVTEMAADPRVTDRSSAIREYYNDATPKRSISTPDGIHLATAILYKADEFQTMDGLEQGGKKLTKLLALNGDVAGYNLSIVQPYPLRNPPSQLVTIYGGLFPKKKDEDEADKK